METIYKAAIFDLDGTLIDSLCDIADAMNFVLQRRNYSPYPYSDYRHMVGNGMRVLTERALPQGSDEQVIQTVLNEMIEYYSLHLLDKTQLYPGIPHLLDQLTQQGIQIAVLSNKPDPLVKTLVKTLLEPYWKIAIARGAQEGVPRKPDPQSSLEIAQAMQLSPQQFLFFGDTNVDMETARRAGMYSIGVTWGFRTEQELHASQARQIIHRPEKWRYPTETE